MITLIVLNWLAAAWMLFATLSVAGVLPLALLVNLPLVALLAINAVVWRRVMKRQPGGR